MKCVNLKLGYLNTRFTLLEKKPLFYHLTRNGETLKNEVGLRKEKDTLTKDHAAILKERDRRGKEGSALWI